MTNKKNELEQLLERIESIVAKYGNVNERVNKLTERLEVLEKLFSIQREVNAELKKIKEAQATIYEQDGVIWSNDLKSNTIELPDDTFDRLARTMTSSPDAGDDAVEGIYVELINHKPTYIHIGSTTFVRAKK